MALTEGGKGNGKIPGWLVILGIALLLVIIFAASGCARVSSGMIVDKVREAGQTVWDCDSKTTGSGKNKTTKKVCNWETDPDKCMFQLASGNGDTGWLEVDCNATFNEYEVGEHYPR